MAKGKTEEGEMDGGQEIVEEGHGNKYDEGYPSDGPDKKEKVFGRRHVDWHIKIIVYPMVIGFIVLAGFVFKLIMDLTSDMGVMSQATAKNMPLMSQYMGEMSNHFGNADVTMRSIDKRMERIEKSIASLEGNMDTITKNTGLMTTAVQNMQKEISNTRSELNKTNKKVSNMTEVMGRSMGNMNRSVNRMNPFNMNNWMP